MPRDTAGSEQGQAAVEFALVVPILLLIVAGILQFGSILSETLVVTAAAREGVRVGAVGSNDTAITQAAKKIASAIDRGKLTVTISPSVRSSGQEITVVVKNPVPLTIPLISTLLGTDTYTVTGSANMRAE